MINSLKLSSSTVLSSVLSLLWLAGCASTVGSCTDVSDMAPEEFAEMRCSRLVSVERAITSMLRRCRDHALIHMIPASLYRPYHVLYLADESTPDAPVLTLWVHSECPDLVLDRSEDESSGDQDQ